MIYARQQSFHLLIRVTYVQRQIYKKEIFFIVKLYTIKTQMFDFDRIKQNVFFVIARH